MKLFSTFALCSLMALSPMDATPPQEATNKVVYQYQTNELTSTDDLVVGNVYRFMPYSSTLDESIEDLSYDETTNLIIKGSLIRYYIENTDDISIDESVSPFVYDFNLMTENLSIDIYYEDFINTQYFLSLYNLYQIIGDYRNDNYLTILFELKNSYSFSDYIDFIYLNYDGEDNLIDYFIHYDFLTACPTTYYYIGDAPTNISLFDEIVGYFENYVFNGETLQTYEIEVFGATTTLSSYLSLVASIVSIVLIVVLAICLVLTIIKFISNMLINLGG